MLAVHLEKDPHADADDKQQKKIVGRDQRVTADDKQSWLQKDGTTRFPFAVWNSMSREQKRQHHRDSEEIRKKNPAKDDTGTKALMTTRKTDGEYDESDSDFEGVLDSTMYGNTTRALIVAKRKQEYDAMDEYDEFMKACNAGLQSRNVYRSHSDVTDTDGTAFMTISTAQFQAAITAAADKAARCAVDAMTTHDYAVSNRGAQRALIRGQLCDSIDDDSIVEKLLPQPSVVVPVSTRWVLLICACATVFLALWWRLTVTSSDEGCNGPE